MKKLKLFLSVSLLISLFLIPTFMIVYFKDWMVIPICLFIFIDIGVIGIFIIYITELIENAHYIGFSSAWKKFIKTAFYG